MLPHYELLFLHIQHQSFAGKSGLQTFTAREAVISFLLQKLMVLNIEKKLSRINLLQYNGSFSWKNFIRN